MIQTENQTKVLTTPFRRLLSEEKGKGSWQCTVRTLALETVNHSITQSILLLKTLLRYSSEPSKVLLNWHCNFFLITFFFVFNNCIVPMGFLPWKIKVAFPGESQLRQSCAIQPTVHAGCFSVSIIHQTLTWIFHMHTDVNACDCTRGCTDTVRESALKADSGRKIPCRTWESNLHPQNASPMFYQLSYIPTLFWFLPWLYGL